jgi:hypothetical protein
MSRRLSNADDEDRLQTPSMDNHSSRKTPPMIFRKLLSRGSGHETGVPNSPPFTSPDSANNKMIISPTNLSRSRRNRAAYSDRSNGLETSKHNKGSSSPHSDKYNKSYSSIGLLSPSSLKKKLRPWGFTSQGSSHIAGSSLDASSGHHRGSNHSIDWPTSPQLLSPNAVKKKFLPQALMKRMGKKSSLSAFDGNTSGVTPLDGHNSFAGPNFTFLDASGVTTFDGHNSFAGHHSGISAFNTSGVTFLDGHDSFALGGVSNHASTERAPRLYQHARMCQWDEFLEQCQVFPENVRYIYRKDGTTALHMAIMSITGYINSFSSSAREFPEASLEIVEEILKIHPEAASVKCTLNGYTPLTYACLVCSDSYDVEQAAKMVRLFVQYAPDSALLLTNEGLTPIDIHIVSYSHYHKSKEEESASGRTSTHVLRLLLMHYPELANLRLRGDKVDGPIEYLYKCNAEAFSDAVLNEVYDSDDEGTVLSNYTIPERRQEVVDAVSKWWIWKWAVMILKYGSLKGKKKGTFFTAVHTAAHQVGCPTNLISLTLYAFPRQVKSPFEDADGLRNLPLHLICSWPCHQDYGRSGSAVVSTRKSMAITRILDEYPGAAKETNARRETALELALKTGTTWDNGVKRLMGYYPKAIKIQSRQTGLYPFMTAAVAATSTHRRQEVQSIRTIYGILRSKPSVLDRCFHKMK